jgi:hypothetical protein
VQNKRSKDGMNRISQDVQNGLSTALLWPILKNPVHPVFAELLLLLNLI